MIHIHPDMKAAYSGTYFGALAVRNFCPTPEGKAAFVPYSQNELSGVREKRKGFDRKRMASEDAVMAAYVKYYKKFKKTYHVLLQTESILQGRELPDTLAPVQVMFLTELQTGMLLSVQDLKKTALPMTVFGAEGGESFLGAGGRDIVLKPRDISVKDEAGVVLSIIYGQDERTRVREEAGDILYVINGVPGIPRETYEQTLDVLLYNLQILHPGLEPVYRAVLKV